MIFIVEAIILCVLFTFLVMMMAKNQIKTLYNYPPKIQERVRPLEQYKDMIPTQKNKIAAKLGASILFIIILSLILRYVNGYTTFAEGFGYGFLLWTIVNAYDAIILDICWFCHSQRFVFEGTEDMIDEYHNYWFHIKGSLIGEVIALSMVLSWYEQKAVCILLTLLHLGVKNILLGPSLPAFISPNVLEFLVKNYNIAPISTPEEDMRKLLRE